MKYRGSLWFMCVFILFCPLTINASLSPREAHGYVNKSEIVETWVKMDKKLKGMVQSLIKQAMPMIMESSERLNLSSQCTTEIFQLISGLRSLKKWAFSFLDSSSKGIDGALTATMSDWGHYDECLGIAVPQSKGKKKNQLQGKYCALGLRPPLPQKSKRYKASDHVEELKNFTGTELLMYLAQMSHLLYDRELRLSVCIPSGCKEGDLNQVAKSVFDEIYFTSRVIRCETKDDPKKEFLGVHKFAISYACILAFFVLLGTFVDIRSTEKKDHKFLKCFSVIKNFSKLFSTRQSESSFGCLHGIRFLSIVLVVLGHAYFYPSWNITNFRSITHIQKITSETLIQVVVNSSMVVDAFFFMSGLLVCYFIMKHVKLQKNSFNVFSFVIHRLWRLIPVYYFVLFFAMLIPLMGSGPAFEDVLEKSIYPCYDTWWRHVIFINNYWPANSGCLMHTWYVAADVQLYLLSILVIIPYFKSEKLGLMVNIGIILVSIIYQGVIMYTKSVAFSIISSYIDVEDQDEGGVYLYENVLVRAGPYFIGVLVGYILVTRPNIKMSKAVQLIGWCISTATVLLVMFATAIWYKLHKPSLVEIFMYATFYHVAYAAGVAWVTFCCLTGHARIIDKMLSWKVWMPLSRLTFLIYLVQPTFQTAHISLFKNTQEITHLQAMVHAFGYLTISAMIAVVLALLVESPFLALEKITIRREGKKEEATPEKKYEEPDIAKMEMNGINDSGYVESGRINDAFDSKM